MTTRSYHDMGGNPAGPVDHHEHTPSLSERRVDAIMMVLRNKPHGLWTTDEHRRTHESLTPELYEGGGYYGRWARGIKGLLVEKGVLTEAEVAAKLIEVKARHAKGGTGSGG